VLFVALTSVLAGAAIGCEGGCPVVGEAPRYSYIATDLEAIGSTVHMVWNRRDYGVDGPPWPEVLQIGAAELGQLAHSVRDVPGLRIGRLAVGTRSRIVIGAELVDLRTGALPPSTTAPLYAHVLGDDGGSSGAIEVAATVEVRWGGGQPFPGGRFSGEVAFDGVSYQVIWVEPDGTDAGLLRARSISEDGALGAVIELGSVAYPGVSLFIERTRSGRVVGRAGRTVFGLSEGVPSPAAPLVFPCAEGDGVISSVLLADEAATPLLRVFSKCSASEPWEVVHLDPETFTELPVTGSPSGASIIYGVASDHLVVAGRNGSYERLWRDYSRTDFAQPFPSSNGVWLVLPTWGFVGGQWVAFVLDGGVQLGVFDGQGPATRAVAVEVDETIPVHECSRFF
jgi:hypothetical protein